MTAVFLENFLQALVAGLLVGAIYGLMCVGLGLIFGVMRVINFAQGDFMMLGMYFALYVVSGLGSLAVLGPAAAPIAAALLAGPALFVGGWVLHRLLLARVTGTRAAISEDVGQAQLVLTLGIALILENGALIAFGSTPQTVHTALSWSAWQIPLAGTASAVLFVNKARGIACLVSIVIGAGLYWLIARTRLGKSLRAAADNPEAATYMGIDVDHAHGVAFGIGTGITAIAGGLVAMYYPFQPYVGFDFVIIMYAGVVLGGMGSILGAFWGGMTIGLVQQLATLVLPLQLQNAAIFAVFLLIVQWRPQGLFGRSGERA
ncbi:MAG TPA: branched-chain amino acid ABC transporter permease [Stellaceae bacterium]|nr:branched-chain amino acid ABC transporter permease [Stellaceae bacterium]